MTSFRFPAEKVLRWRHTQLELDKAWFRRQAARALAEMEASAIGAEAELRAKVVMRDLSKRLETPGMEMTAPRVEKHETRLPLSGRG